MKTRNILLRAAVNLIILLSLLGYASHGLAANKTQSFQPDPRAQALLERMTDAERVGQLFLVTFRGVEVGEETSVYDLITSHHAGGVVLLAENDNFGIAQETSEGVVPKVLSTSRQVQLNRWSYAQQERPDPATGQPYTPQYIPLFVGMTQEGDGWPNDQLLTGVTRLPSLMAIGATWDTKFAEQTGLTLGSELTAIGINLLLGPSLDILEDPNPAGNSGLGTGVFNGDPFWVGQMGRAYIRGVHQGSAGKIAVAARHFPGIGSADRLPEEEVATVRKSLEQLQLFDLAPFYDVTGSASDVGATTDALLVSHMRYQGFQGNIRATTRPVSFDQQALALLMNLQPFAAWRQTGGVLISDDLGSRSVRRFYELTNPGQPFDARRVALNAFLAGNDMLYIGNILSSDDADQYVTATRIIDFFTQKYREDPAFAERVNQSALRILGLKYRLFGRFDLETTVQAIDMSENLGMDNQVSFDVARQAATLISPSLAELENSLPDPPNRNDRIVFITDLRQVKQCSQCLEQPLIAVDGLQQAVSRLYGPQATGQVTPAYLKSYSYEDLTRLLDGETGTAQLEMDIRRARWLVFAMLDVRRELPASRALHRFLAERPELFQQKNLVAFAFNAPYYLDATDISKLTAYYGLYSKTPSFIEMAARLLFKELPALGNSPISIEGIGYDLISATQPDPNQVIPLFLDNIEGVEPSVITTTAQITPPVQPPLELTKGSVIAIRTGVIQDHNGHPVPDGTPAHFITALNGTLSGLPLSVTTQAGIAQIVFQVPGTGTLEIRVESEPAKSSDILRFEIPEEVVNGFTPTPTEQPTATPTITPTPTQPPPPVSPPAPVLQVPPGLADWIIACVLAIVISLLSYQISAMLGQVRWGVRSAFLSFIGGLLAYTSLTLPTDLSLEILESMGRMGVIMTTIAGCATGIAVTWLWRNAQNRSSLED
jgi:beta-N-acetylhexosaminidase